MIDDTLPAALARPTHETPHGFFTLAVNGYSRLDRGWLRWDRYTSRETGQSVVERYHCAGRDDVSPPRIARAYDSRCSWCYLGYGHTEAAHETSKRALE